MVRLGLIRFGQVWTVRLGLIRFGQVWLDLVRFCYVWLDLVKLGQDRCGQVRLDQSWLGFVRFRQVRFVLVRISLIRLGLVGLDLNSFGQVRLGWVRFGLDLDRFGQVFQFIVTNFLAQFHCTGCPIWKATKVNLYCGYVFRVRNLQIQIFDTHMCPFCFLEKSSDKSTFGFQPYF